MNTSDGSRGVLVTGASRGIGRATNRADAAIQLGAFRGEPDHPAYAASKAALHAFAQSAAIALAPGFVATERQRAKLTGADGDALRADSPFGRVGTPGEIAAAIVFLASPEAAWSSGAILDANGASYLRTWEP